MNFKTLRALQFITVFLLLLKGKKVYFCYKCGPIKFIYITYKMEVNGKSKVHIMELHDMDKLQECTPP